MRFQGYNGGSAPFPYATECSAAATECATDALVAEMEFPGSAEPVDLGIAAATADGPDAVELVSVQAICAMSWFGCVCPSVSHTPSLSCSQRKQRTDVKLEIVSPRYEVRGTIRPPLSRALVDPIPCHAEIRWALLYLREGTTTPCMGPSASERPTQLRVLSTTPCT